MGEDMREIATQRIIQAFAARETGYDLLDGSDDPRRLVIAGQEYYFTEAQLLRYRRLSSAQKTEFFDLMTERALDRNKEREQALATSARQMFGGGQMFGGEPTYTLRYLPNSQARVNCNACDWSLDGQNKTAICAAATAHLKGYHHA